MKTASDLIQPSANLLPTLAEVEAAIEENTRERRRLFTIRRLIVETRADKAEEETNGVA